MRALPGVPEQLSLLLIDEVMGRHGCEPQRWLMAVGQRSLFVEDPMATPACVSGCQLHMFK